LGYQPGRHARPPWRAPHPHNHQMPARRAAHHAIGMKSGHPAAQIRAILSRSPQGVQTKLVPAGDCPAARRDPKLPVRGARSVSRPGPRRQPPLADLPEQEMRAQQRREPQLSRRNRRRADGACLDRGEFGPQLAGQSPGGLRARPLLEVVVATSRFRPSARGRVQIAARPRSRRRATRTSGPGPMCGNLAVARPRPPRQMRGRPLPFTPLAGPKAAIPTRLISSAATAVTIPTRISARSHPSFSRSAGTTRFRRA
jgi:hypothetical protein